MMDERYVNPYKVYVEVVAKFNINGSVMPCSLIWEDGRVYDIDKILAIDNVASMKAGGMGVRYEFEIEGQNKYIWRDEDRWFMERK